VVVLNQSENLWDSQDRALILGFIEYCFKELHITSPVTIKLEKDTKSNFDIGVKINLRLAFVNLEDRLVIIYTKDRGLLDVLRSIAHELIHLQQLDMGQLTTSTVIDFYLPSPDAPGYEFEYEAYGLSGIMVRNYRALLNKDSE
jgi:hypothetical protein